MRLLEEILKDILAREKEAGRLLEDNASSGQNQNNKLSQASGIAPAISQGTAATDNLSSMMKNTVVIFVSELKVVITPSTKQADVGTASGRHDSSYEVIA